MSPWQRRHFVPATLLVCLAAACVMPVVWLGVWPNNHDGVAFFQLTTIYADHIRVGDVLPIWSSTDSLGFGSPQPLLYHKLFYLVSGALYAVSHALAPSTLVTVWLYLCVGGLGMYAAARRMGCSVPLALSSGMMLLGANYTVTNWLVRGAMAEFSGAMLVPLVFLTFLASLDTRPGRLRDGAYLGATLAAIYLAHSVLVFYLTLLLFAATIVVVASRQVRVTRWHFLRLGVAIAVTIVLVLPFLVTLAKIAPDYDMGRIVPPRYLPENRIHPFVQYLWDSGWTWGARWSSYTVQLDTAPLTLLMVGLVVATVQRVRHPRSSRSSSADATAATVLATIIVLALALQLPAAIPFYRHVPGAKYLQFPWRLLAVLTPSIILLSVWTWERRAPRLAIPIVSLATLILLVSSGTWRLHHASVLPFPTSMSLDGLKRSAFGEYVPVAAPPEGYVYGAVVADLARQGCQLVTRKSTRPELQDTTVRSYDVACQRSGTIPLPVLASPLHRVTLETTRSFASNLSRSTAGGTGKACLPTDSHPGLCGVRLDVPGSYRVHVHFPTLSHLLW